MLFLLNDVVLSLKSGEAPPPPQIRDKSVSFDQVLLLCAEAFSVNPMLHRTNPAMSLKIASLINAKAPQINAALFVPPSPRCPPEKVTCRYADLAFDVISGLSMKQLQGKLTTAVVDEMVWGRLAAA